MGVRNNVSKLKGKLTIDLENDEILLSVDVKGSDKPEVYDLLSELAIYEDKFINITITENIEVEPIN